MRKNSYYIFILLLLSFSCSQEPTTKNDIAFYHWKAKADYTQSYDKAITTTSASQIYMHYFDIESIREPSWRDDGVFPTYVLKSVAEEYRNFEIVPVVYITNNIFKIDGINIIKLAEKITKLIHQISSKHFNKKMPLVQIDCDWTQSTKAAYFQLLKILKSDFELDVTIRLHQIKFQDRTGVPPVNMGTLMLYNMGDLRNKNQNSILESAIVKQYINAESSFPLRLNIALPLFSQTVISNNTNKLKLINKSNRAVLENDSHFKKLNSNNFQVVSDTLYKGFYLAKGYNLKLEELNESEIVSSCKVIKESQLKIKEIIFYHLDDHVLSNYDFKNLIEKL